MGAMCRFDIAVARRPGSPAAPSASPRRGCSRCPAYAFPACGPASPASAYGGIARRRARTGWLWTAPALTVIALVTVFPVLYSVLLSFTKVRFAFGGLHVEEWTLRNYTTVAASPDWLAAPAFTVGYTGAAGWSVLCCLLFLRMFRSQVDEGGAA